jgi:hypothetical protein
VSEPTPGAYYRHWKGTLYKCLAVAKHTETQEVLVVYADDKTGVVWCRPLASWNTPARVPGDIDYREGPRFAEEKW